MDRGKLTDLIAVVVIAIVGLLSAYITFGVLQSQADAKIQGYSVGGAIAGALVTMSVLASVYGQFRKSSTETEELRSRNEELQQKLIRGAPRPPGFDTQVDERQRIVLALPRNWQPRGGVVFDFEVDPNELPQDDLVPPRFWLQYSMVAKDADPPDIFYNKYLASVTEADSVESHTSEFLHIGGEGGSGIKSLKIIAHEFARALKWSDPLTGKVSYSWDTISRKEYEAQVAKRRRNEDDKKAVSMGNEKAASGDKEKGTSPDEEKQEAVSDAEPIHDNPRLSGATRVLEGPVMLSRMRVICYHTALQRIYQFDFIDDDKDFPASSILFNQLLASVRFLT